MKEWIRLHANQRTTGHKNVQQSIKVFSSLYFIGAKGEKNRAHEDVNDILFSLPDYDEYSPYKSAQRFLKSSYKPCQILFQRPYKWNHAQKTGFLENSYKSGGYNFILVPPHSKHLRLEPMYQPRQPRRADQNCGRYQQASTTY